METTQKFIYKNNLYKGAKLRRKKDNVIIELTGKFIKTKLGFIDWRVGDKNSWLAEYKVIESPYRKHILVSVYSAGGHSGSYERTDKFNPFGEGSVWFINLTLFSHPNIIGWEVIDKSEKEIPIKNFLTETNSDKITLKLK